MGLTEQLAQQDRLELQVFKVQLDQLVYLAPTEQLAQQDPLELKVLLVFQLQDLREPLVIQAPLAQQDPLELKVLLV
jgi:hypothetical protein